ncbi:DUF6088 family protein [Sphingobacterium sp. UBA1498]|uniref:DUF6088 family protein n=1 Tax=Sphingobacterium sp. UBA1498 TaxID=1947481 RepID=UPI0025ECEC9A|nr:DUF6088 family protein [Sphingobacterium sp. UBA1498]
MGVTQKIQKQISKLAEGTTFKYEKLDIEPQEFSATAKAIERLIAQGVIKRVSTGVFYKPKKTVFGELKPNEEEILKHYLFEKGKRIAYITGTSLYNRLGLTTQVPKSIKIASRDKRITVSNGNVKASPVKSYVNVTDKNFYLLELLDSLKDFKKIPDLDKSSAIKILLTKLRELNSTETKLLIKCGLAYPPRVRSFLGALLENINTESDLTTLKTSLNPLSEYEYGISEKQLATAENWNIK